MPDTHRMHLPRRAAAAALAPWLPAAGLALTLALTLTTTAPVHAQAFGEVQSPPAQVLQQLQAQDDLAADVSTDSTLVGYTLYTNPDGTVMYLPRREIDIGRGTTRLLEMQHSRPGQRARPIEGEQARRSYARYLKSFETEIPALYKTGAEAGGKN